MAEVESSMHTETRLRSSDRKREATYQATQEGAGRTKTRRVTKPTSSFTDTPVSFSRTESEEKIHDWKGKQKMKLRSDSSKSMKPESNIEWLDHEIAVEGHEDAEKDYILELPNTITEKKLFMIIKKLEKDTSNRSLTVLVKKDDTSANFLKKTDFDFESVRNKEVQIEAAKSVGIIRGPKCTGTGLRVGPDYVITAWHVIKDNTAAKSKTSEYEKKGEVKVPDPSNLKELHQLRHQKSILQAQITNQANTISEQTEELYTLKSRIHQLVAEVAAQKEFITYAASNQLKKCEMNMTKMEKIVRNVLADVLYDLLKLYKKKLQERNAYDVTKLYYELKTLDKHIPSYGWGSTWESIKKQHTAIGDDIERIRLIRNELQHYGNYEINCKRYKVLLCMIHSLLARLDKYIKSIKCIEPSQPNFYLEEVKKIERLNDWSV